MNLVLDCTLLADLTLSAREHTDLSHLDHRGSEVVVERRRWPVHLLHNFQTRRVPLQLIVGSEDGPSANDVGVVVGVPSVDGLGLIHLNLGGEVALLALLLQRGCESRVQRWVGLDWRRETIETCLLERAAREPDCMWSWDGDADYVRNSFIAPAAENLGSHFRFWKLEIHIYCIHFSQSVSQNPGCTSSSFYLQLQHSIWVNILALDNWNMGWMYDGESHLHLYTWKNHHVLSCQTLLGEAGDQGREGREWRRQVCVGLRSQWHNAISSPEGNTPVFSSHLFAHEIQWSVLLAKLEAYWLAEYIALYIVQWA